MGNCCGRDSAVVWASVGEWYEPSSQTDPPLNMMEKLDVECPAGDDNRAPNSASASAPVVVNLNKEQVKIKITKRELEELVASASVQEVPMDRFLSLLINAVDHDHDHDHEHPINVHPRRSWAPALYSIAE